MANIEEILKRFADARARVKDADVRKLLDQVDADLRAALQELDKERLTLQQKLDETSTSLSELQSRAAEQERRIAALQAQVDGKDVPVTSAQPLDLARSFREVIQTIQAEARGADEVGVTIRTMDLEIKGLVEVAEKQTSMVLPTAQAPVDPALLSTLRLSFSAVPTVRDD
jgi:cell division septum initiation protein DivIVA